MRGEQALVQAELRRFARQTWQRVIAGIALSMLAASMPAAQPHVPADPDFTVRDFLGRYWRNESVRFELTDGQLARARAGRALAGPDGKPVPYQLLASAAGARPAIEFAIDVEPLATKPYRFTSARAVTTTDLQIEETADRIRLSNDRTGISIRKRLEAGNGPLAGIRLASGTWVADSFFASTQQIASYSARVVANGPVFVEIVCTIALANGAQWQLRFRLQAYEPVVLVDETFSLEEPAAFVLRLNEGFAPTHLLYRYGMEVSGSEVGRLATAPLDAAGAPLFLLEPWLHWWERQRQGTWFGIYGERANDLLAFGAREAAAWVDPLQPPHLRTPPQLPLAFERTSLTWRLPLRNGARKWMIGVFDRDASLKPLAGKDHQTAPLPQQYFVKHGDFRLDRIKDYVLTWKERESARPRLIVTGADIASWRRHFKIDPARVVQLAGSPLSELSMDDVVAFYLASGDRALGGNLAATAVRWLQDAVDVFLRQDRFPTLGFAPHRQWRILTAINLADAIWGSEHLSPSARELLRAQIAFLAYTVNRDDYWSPERGFGANPNMTTTVATFRTVLGCMIADHPLAAGWVARGMRELGSQLDGWADENGGWLEAPHYALVSYDHLVGAFLAARNAGFQDRLHDPKMKKVIEWLAKISTPPEAAANGYRHLPPIGNTLMREPSGEFGVIAGLWKERDPRFAGEMQWMHRQHGAQPTPGLGGFFPTLAGYRSLLVDPTVAPIAPAYKSEWFARTGVMLRHHFPSSRETQLHLIAGPNHAHYDRDSGSFTLWGKGRLVANDFGYTGHGPGDDHNMLVSPGAPDSAVMQIARFVVHEQADYVRGRKNTWSRQIIFVKDADALGPNYFVIADDASDAQAISRTWFTARAVELLPDGAFVRGREDVDTDLFFVRTGAGARSTERRTRETWGLTGTSYGRVSTEQTAVIVPAGAVGVTTVVYPRLASQKRPVFTRIAEGRGVKVETAAGTDYVFVSRQPFSFAGEGITFSGSVGAVLVRDGDVRLWLGDAGSIAARGKSLKQ